jgi:hypothetical protein
MKFFGLQLKKTILLVTIQIITTKSITTHTFMLILHFSNCFSRIKERSIPAVHKIFKNLGATAKF